jgi:hypothetical protein
MKIFNKIYDILIFAVEFRHYYSTYINYLMLNIGLIVNINNFIFE